MSSVKKKGSKSTSSTCDSANNAVILSGIIFGFYQLVAVSLTTSSPYDMVRSQLSITWKTSHSNMSSVLLCWHTHPY